MKRSKKSRPRPNATAALEFDQLEYRMVLNGDLGGVVLADNTQFDDQGRVWLQELTFDFDNDQLADLRTIDQYQYNADGLATNYLHQEDNGADGIVDSQYWIEQEYAEDGGLLELLEAWDNEGDGQREGQVRSTWTYDQNAKLIHSLTESDVDGDGTYDESFEENYDPNGGDTSGGDYHVDTQDSYDESGRLIRSTYTHFEGGDDVPDSVEVVSWRYQESGLVDTISYEIDNDADGVIDYRSIGTNEYDDDSELTAIHHQVDENADGVIDSSYSENTFWRASPANAGENRDYSTGELGPRDSINDESTGRSSLNVAAVSSIVSSDTSASLLSKKAASETHGAKPDGPGAGDRLQLAGSIVFDADRSDNAVRDVAISFMGRESNDIFDEEATWILMGSIDSLNRLAMHFPG